MNLAQAQHAVERARDAYAKSTCANCHTLQVRPAFTWITDGSLAD